MTCFWVKNPKDWDITTSATPQNIMELFPKNIPTGLRHGTITVCMGEGIENHFEVTTFRTEGEYSDGRRPDEVRFVKNVEEDLARRDLTINAIAYDPITNRLVDPFNGLLAIQHKMIHAVGDPTARFQEDGLRIMRVARFAARFGWSVSSSTEDGMKASLETLKKVSKERISDELSKTLMAAHPGYGLVLLQDTGALDVVCPLLAGRQLPMIPRMHMLQMCTGELETKLAFLYNKLNIKKVEEELVNLKFSGKEVKRVLFQLNLLEKFWEIEDNCEWQIPAYKKFIAFIKNESPDPYEYTLGQFIGLSEALGFSTGSTIETYQTKVPIVFSRKEMQINGDDLLAAGMVAGPRIKKALEACYLEILREPSHNTKNHLLEVAKQH